MRRLFVIVVSVLAAGTAGVLPARASTDGVVDRIHQLRAAGTVTLTEDGRAISSDLVGDEVLRDRGAKRSYKAIHAVFWSGDKFDELKTPGGDVQSRPNAR